MTDTSMTSADLSTLNADQLRAMVEIRGRAISRGIGADTLLLKKIGDGTLTGDDIRMWNEEKEAILIELGEAETATLFPAGSSSRVN